MAYAEKYKMTFYDLLGSNWVVSLRVLNYTDSTVYTIEGTDDPLTINYDGDEDDPYDTFRSSKATININMDANCLLLIDDLQDIDDATIYVDITSDTGQHVSGFVVPDQFSKGLSTIDGSITLTTQDFLVLMKGVSAYNSDGTIIYNKHNVFDYVESQVNSAVYGADTININVINPYTLINLLGTDIFHQLAVRAESFNTTDGRVDTAYNILQKIFVSFLSVAYFEGNKFNIICPNGLDTTTYKTIYLKNNNATNFLIGNEEEISYIRGVKEVSAEIKFGTENGLLVNPFFLFWSTGVNPVPQNWTRTSAEQSISTLTRVGNSRAESQGGAKLQQIYPSGGTGVGFYVQGLDQSYRVYKGWQYKLTYGMVYRDYVQEGWHTPATDTTSRPPAIVFWVVLAGDDGNSYYYRNNGTGETWTSPTTSNLIYKELQSTVDVQSISADLPPLPVSGVITITLTTVDLDASFYGVTSSTMDRTAIIYNNVILNTENVPAGQTDYLTQVKNYTLKADKADIYLQTGISDNIAGALYSNLNQGVFVLLDYNTILRTGETTYYSLLHQYVRAKMAMHRSARKKIICKVYSNNIFFSDLIKFDSNTGIDGVFMQLKRDYDVKNCEQSITAIEINPQFLDDIDAFGMGDIQIASYPNAATDLYEHYNTTS